MRAFFDTYGFVVVRDVVDTTQVRATLQEVWDTVITAPQPAASTKPVAPADPSTWGASNWPSSASVANGMTTKEVQFTPAFLENRGNPRVAATCAVLLRTPIQRLVASHDRATLFRGTRFESSHAQWHGLVAMPRDAIEPWRRTPAWGHATEAAPGHTTDAAASGDGDDKRAGTTGSEQATSAACDAASADAGAATAASPQPVSESESPPSGVDRSVVVDQPAWRSKLNNLHVDINPVDTVFYESRVIASRRATTSVAHACGCGCVAVAVWLWLCGCAGHGPLVLLPRWRERPRSTPPKPPSTVCGCTHALPHEQQHDNQLERHGSGCTVPPRTPQRHGPRSFAAAAAGTRGNIRL